MGKLYPLHGYDLAPLQEFDRSLFLSQGDKNLRKINAFFLSLALIYNYLKGVLWVLSTLKEGQKEEPDVSGYSGQLAVMDRQMFRYMIGILSELLILIEKNKDVLESSAVIRIVGSWKTKYREKWDQIVDFSRQTKKSKGSKDPVVKLLEAIRNNSSFHYHGIDNQMIGYHKWLESKKIGSDFIYASFGRTFKETRFYFADAASEGYVNHQLGLHGLDIESVKPLVVDVVEVLHNLVQIYLKELALPEKMPVNFMKGN